MLTPPVLGICRKNIFWFGFMNFLIIGGNSFLGRNLIHVLKGKGEVFATYNHNKPSDLDAKWLHITLPNDVDKLLIYNRNDITIFYLAGITIPKKVEENPDEAYNINIQPLKYITENFNNIHNLIFTSSDVVYGDDEAKIFTENDIPKPINEYGNQKLIAENLVLKYGGLVLRLSQIFGADHELYQQVSKAISCNHEILLDNSSTRMAIDVKIVIEMILKLLEEKSAIYNICGDKPLTRYQMVKANIDPKYHHLLKEFKMERSEKRAKHIYMSNKKVIKYGF